MNSSDHTPKLPAWLFVLFNVAAIIVAALIVGFAPRPLSSLAILSTVASVAIGALAGLVPLVAYFERQKNAALDERQSALEALARTVASSADQISIAAGGLHDVADLAQKNLRHAEQLPHRLQEKVAEFQAQLSQAADADREELERELLALRTTESERLESVSQRIAKSSAEWSKLEAATQHHLAAANDAVAKLAFGTADAIGKAQAAAEQALAQARTEAARDIGQAIGTGTKSVEAAKAAALAELETKVAAAAQAAAAAVAAELTARLDSVTAALDDKIARLEAAASQVPTIATAERPPVAELPAPVAAEPPAPSESESPPDDATAPFAVSAPAPAAKRPRKPRRDEPPAEAATPAIPPIVDSPASPEAAGSEPAAADSVVEPAASAPPPESPAPVVPDEPAPVPAANIVEITPVAPKTAEPFPIEPRPPANGSPAPTPPTSGEPETEKPARKRAAKKAEPEPDENPSLDLELDDMPGASSVGIAERVLTSDGATRLLVTAYIGIGNRLFIRGEGPGLSWEKGVPLQFVSIGKWRWETNDASAPVQFKLYKNDVVECAALGAQTLDPAHQQEVTATF